MKRLIFFIVFFIYLSSPLISYGSEFSHGLNAKNNGNYEEAVSMFKVAAKKGDKFSQHCLGVMLYKGLGVTQNHEEAFKWLNKAAKQGFSQAKLDLEILIYYKKGVPKDYKHKF